MSEYKNFSTYNTAAESVRPSARIQLVQRILNAANIISNLVNGVPLKWASSYKSFQVLKYSENSSPEDVTSANAISAVDSILHEAESQIRSSNDDMNTLLSEIQRMNTTGYMDYWNLTCPELKVNDSYYYICVVTPGAGTADMRYIGVKITGSPYFQPTGFCLSASEWNALTNAKIVVSTAENKPSSTWMKTTNLAGTGSFLQHFMFACGATLQDADERNRAAIILETINMSSTCYIYLALGSASYKVAIPWNSSTSGSIAMTSSTDFAANVINSTGFAVGCHVNPKDILGLPDPTNVISILDNM